MVRETASEPESVSFGLAVSDAVRPKWARTRISIQSNLQLRPASILLVPQLKRDQIEIAGS